jgi:hypothetical protein
MAQATRTLNDARLHTTEVVEQLGRLFAEQNLRLIVPSQFVDSSNARFYCAGHAQNIRKGPALENGDVTIIGGLVARASVP